MSLSRFTYASRFCFNALLDKYRYILHFVCMLQCNVLPVEQVGIILVLEAIILVIPDVLSMYRGVEHHLYEHYATTSKRKGPLPFLAHSQRSPMCTMKHTCSYIPQQNMYKDCRSFNGTYTRASQSSMFYY